MRNIIINDKHRGRLNAKTKGIVMNSSPLRPGVNRISYYITEKLDFWIGETTVAVFRITKIKQS